MKKKMDFNKIVYASIAFLFIVIIITAVSIAIKNRNDVKDVQEIENSMIEAKGKREAEISEIEEGSLPSKEELVSVGLEDVMQASKINKQFNLYNYEMEDGGIKYNYLANAVTNGERLSISAKVMTEEEYKKMLPEAKMQKDTVDGIEVVYNDRSLYYTVDGEDLPGYVKNALDAGNVVVRYGNSTSELLPMQQIMWYTDGIGYTLESISRNYSYEDMAELVKDFLSEVK